MSGDFGKQSISRLVLIGLVGILGTLQTFDSFPNKLPLGANTSGEQNKFKYNQELIVLVHGLMRTYRSMSPLKSYLEKQGYRVYYYKYPSARYSIHNHALLLNEFIIKLLAENPGITVHFITHSLGGIIVREALARLPKEQLKKIGSLIMLAPPNQGSALAKLSVKVFPMVTYFIKPLIELSPDQTAYVHHVPVPNIKIGIIAGRFDAKVPLSSARLDGLPEPIVVNTTHTFIMNHRRTKELIKNFLEKGTFGGIPVVCSNLIHENCL